MANIASNAAYMNDLEISADAPITEDLMNKIGANINYLLDLAALGAVTFTSSGNYTTGENVTRLYLLMCGGGGGGGGGLRHTGVPDSVAGGAAGGGGGAGGSVSEGMLEVVGNTIYPVTVGTGGAAGAYAVNSSPGAGGQGGASQFGSGFIDDTSLNAYPGNGGSAVVYNGTPSLLAPVIPGGSNNNYWGGGGDGGSTITNANPVGGSSRYYQKQNGEGGASSSVGTGSPTPHGYGGAGGGSIGIGGDISNAPTIGGGGKGGNGGTQNNAGGPGQAGADGIVKVYLL